jgi:hypothetical protein
MLVHPERTSAMPAGSLGAGAGVLAAWSDAAGAQPVFWAALWIPIMLEGVRLLATQLPRSRHLRIITGYSSCQIYIGVTM